MENKILQIMPAPLGSWISEVSVQKDNQWESLHPAACLALVERTYDGETDIEIVPMGFGEDLHCDYFPYIITKLHKSFVDANEWIKDAAKRRLAWQAKLESTSP